MNKPTLAFLIKFSFPIYIYMAGANAWALPQAIVIDPAWQQVERIDLPDGTVQLRIKPKPALATLADETKVTESRVASSPPVPTQPELNQQIRDRLAVDLSVPASPAMAVLGVGNTEIQRPAFPRELAASLIRGLDKDGKNRDAVAVDVVPASLWFRTNVIGGDDYIAHPWTMQLLARTTVSLGASKVDDSSQGSQYGAGIRIGLIDKADPGLHWKVREDCLRPIFADMPVSNVPVKNGGPVSIPLPEKAVAQCDLDLLVADLWAKPALYVGYAQGWHSDSKSVRDAKGNAKAFWASYSVGLNARTKDELKYRGGSDRVRALLQLHLARKIDETISNPSGAGDFVREDRTEFVARLRFGKIKWHTYVEAGAARTRTGGLETESIRRVGFGAEYMLRDDLWLVLGSLRETGFRDGTRSLLNTGLRFSQVPKGLFGLPDLAEK